MPSHGYALYLALGDSLSIDKYAGHGLGAAALLHHNNDRLWPEFAGRDLVTLNPHCRFENRAQDGHQSSDVEAELGGLPEPPGRTLITLTLGGNDLIALFNQGKHDFTPVLARMSAILTRLRSRYPECTLLLSNVYDPTDGTGQVQSGHRRFAAALPVMRQFNARLAGLGATVVDVHGHFQGHGMRYRDSGFEHYHPHDPSAWFCFDIEPNARGSSEIRRLFWEALP